MWSWTPSSATEWQGLAISKNGREGLGLSTRYLVVYFYAGYGLVALTQPDKPKRSFDVLTGLFDRVGLRMNTSKMVIIACHP